MIANKTRKSPRKENAKKNKIFVLAFLTCFSFVSQSVPPDRKNFLKLNYSGQLYSLVCVWECRLIIPASAMFQSSFSITAIKQVSHFIDLSPLAPIHLIPFHSQLPPFKGYRDLRPILAFSAECDTGRKKKKIKNQVNLIMRVHDERY